MGTGHGFSGSIWLGSEGSSHPVWQKTSPTELQMYLKGTRWLGVEKDKKPNPE